MQVNFMIYLTPEAFSRDTIFSEHREYFESAFARAPNGAIHADDMKVLIRELKRKFKDSDQPCKIKTMTAVYDYSNLQYRRKPPFETTARHEVFKVV